MFNDTQIQIGKSRTIRVSISILLVSLHTIYFYHVVHTDVETKKMIQQGIRFLLTGGLLFATYKCQKWAQVVSVILYSIAVFSAVIGLATNEIPFVNSVPLLVMVFVYSYAIYHFGFSDSYKAFFKDQN